MPTSLNRGADAYAIDDPAAYPWGWLAVVGAVIVMIITGAGWLYQKNGERPVPATQDPRNAAHEQMPIADADHVAGLTSPSDVASSPSLSAPSTLPMQSEPAVAEPSAAPEPASPLPGTAGTEADGAPNHAGTDAPHVPSPARTALPLQGIKQLLVVRLGVLKDGLDVLGWLG